MSTSVFLRRLVRSVSLCPGFANSVRNSEEVGGSKMSQLSKEMTDRTHSLRQNCTYRMLDDEFPPRNRPRQATHSLTHSDRTALIECWTMNSHLETGHDRQLHVIVLCTIDFMWNRSERAVVIPVCVARSPSIQHTLLTTCQQLNSVIRSDILSCGNVVGHRC